MPFESFEQPPIPPAEEEEKPEQGETEMNEKSSELKEFTEEELKEATERIAVVGDIQNISPETLAKINPENVDPILDLSINKIAKERHDLNEKTFKGLEEGMEELSNRSSVGHILLCAVNGKEDFKSFRDCLEKFIEKKKVKETDDRILYLRETVNRQIEMEGLSEELFKIECKKIIGDIKKDDAFFIQSVPQLENLTPRIEETLNYFKTEEVKSKRGEVKDKSGMDIKNLTGDIEENLDLIKNQKTELVKGNLHNLCLDVSKLRWIDFEKLNEKKMKETVNSFKEPLTREEIEKLREKENIERLERLPLIPPHKMELILTYLGEMPVSSIGFVFENKDVYKKEIKNKISEISVLKKILPRIGLKFKISEYVNQTYPQVELSFGKNEKDLKRLEKATQGQNHKKMGRLFGFPESAIQAYVREKQQHKKEGELTLNAEELLKGLPEEEKGDLLKEGVLNFLNFRVSKDNWKKELETVRRWQKTIKEKAPKSYQEIISTGKFFH